MLRLITLLTISLSLPSYAVGVSDVMKELNSFRNGLEKRQLLLRYQIDQIVDHTKSQKNELNSLRVLKRESDFLDYLLGQVDKMNISKSSKRYVKNKTSKIVSMISKASLSNNREPAVIEAIPAPAKLMEQKRKKNLFKRAKALATAKSKTKRNVWLFVVGAAACLIGMFASSFMFFRRNKKVEAESGALKLRMFNEITTPVIFIDESQSIFWANTSAKGSMGLTKGSSFFMEEEVEADPVEDKIIFRDELGKRHFVEAKEVKLKGIAYNMLMFFPIMASVNNRAFRKSEDSFELGAAIESALEKYNYLFSSNSIPVAINQTCESSNVSKGEEEIFQKLIYLGYQMAKDLSDTRVNVTIGEHKARSTIQMDVKGLKSENLDFGQRVYLSAKRESNLGDLWTELELAMAHREARVFMFDNNDYDTEHFSIVLSFNKTWESGVEEKGSSPRETTV